jgi:type IV pilus assembly protein PilC
MLTQAVYIAANATNNSYIINQMDEGAKKMQQGEMLSSILGRIDGFNSRIVHVALIGEETGELGDVLEKMAFSFDEETDAAVSRMLTLLTPAILVVMAGIVGSVVFAVMMPIMTLYQGM